MLCLTSPAVSVTAGGEVNQGCSTRPAPPVRRTIAHTNRGLHGHGKQYAQAVTACASPPSRQQAGHPGNHLRAHSGTRGLPQGAPAGGQGSGGRAGARARRRGRGGGLLYSVAKEPGLSTSIIPWAAKGQRRGCGGAGAAQRRDGSQEAAGKAGDGPAHTQHMHDTGGRTALRGGRTPTAVKPHRSCRGQAPHLCLRATAVAGHRCRWNAVPPARGPAPTPRGWRWPRAWRAAVAGRAARRGQRHGSTLALATAKGHAHGIEIAGIVPTAAAVGRAGGGWGAERQGPPINQ